MGPSRHNARAAAGSAGSSSNRNDESTSASASASRSPAAPSRTPTRPSPYTRTPNKPSSSALTLGPSTPTSRTSSPMMLREIFSMISPFRGLSRARRSAAFGAADEVNMDQDTSDADDGAPLGQPSELENVEEGVDAEDRMIEDAEEGFSTGAAEQSARDAPSSQLSVLSDAPSTIRSPSPRPRSSLAPTAKHLPLADSGLVTPGLRRQFAASSSHPISSTPLASTSQATPAAQTSPVSRNYDLLARFFSEKQRGGQGGLTEVEVEGCIRLIEESMATGRNLESEFAGASQHGRHFAPVQIGGFAPSSRASSIAPPAFPSSQSTNTLFHPGTSKFNTSSSAYSFLAPRAPASQSGSGAAMSSSTSSTRRRPIYLGPGMSGLSLNRRRPVVASASRAAAMAKTQGFSSMPRSSTDPNLARYARNGADETHDVADRAEEAKRRRTGMDAASLASSVNGRVPSADETVQFEPAYEKQARQSSLLARDIATSSPSKVTSTISPLKRAAPSQEAVAAAGSKTSPPKTTTRTASAIQDILKTTPPVRPPTKPELVNPYQSAAPLPAKSKPAAEEAIPVRRSARTSMLTRAKARETARAAEKHSPPKESVLELIERTAPKTISKRNVAPDTSESRRNGVSSAPELASKPSSESTGSTEERKLQKTEEVQRRLEALNKAKSQQKEEQSSNAPKAAVADNKSSSKISSNLLPPQYTASKPKKPSPLSAAFQAPDSPSSDTEMTSASAAQSRGPAIAQPSFSFGSPAKTTPPSSGFSFGAAKPSDPSAAAAPSSAGFSFSKPVASTTPASSAAPAKIPSFSFSPVATAPSQQKPAASAAPASTGFSFSTPSSSSVSTAASSSSGATSQPSSIRSQVLAEDASSLPRFDWQVPAVAAFTSLNADKALRDEIKLAAESALPKFDFVYEVTTSSDAEKSGAAKTAAAPASAGFSFSASAPASAPAATPSATGSDSAAESESTDDPSKPSSSGLLGEGEGEESESTLLTVRSKIWRLDMSTKSWKDLGVCVAKIKHDSSTNKHRLLARNEANGKVAVNFLVYKGLKSSLDKTVNAFLGFDGKDPTQYRMKVKTEDDAKEFKSVLEEAAGKS
ncbi:RanBD1 domain-containing protein [Pseudozyma hubeiensis]|nr:RanBD1 domain-containing protein [Pseudozyma hubeiensis]